MKLIVVVDKNWGIGKDNDLLFKLKEDMKHFRQETMGKTVVMGLRTFESLPGQKVLPGRKNIVLGGKNIEGACCADSLSTLAMLLRGDVLDNACGIDEVVIGGGGDGGLSHSDVFVIGGASVYRTMLPYCEEAIITKVDAQAQADVFFENLDSLPNWEIVSESESVKDGDYTIKFVVYKNKNVRDFVAENLQPALRT